MEGASSPNAPAPKKICGTGSRRPEKFEFERADKSTESRRLIPSTDHQLPPRTGWGTAPGVDTGKEAQLGVPPPTPPETSPLLPLPPLLLLLLYSHAIHLVTQIFSTYVLYIGGCFRVDRARRPHRLKIRTRLCEDAGIWQLRVDSARRPHHNGWMPERGSVRTREFLQRKIWKAGPRLGACLRGIAIGCQARNNW